MAELAKAQKTAVALHALLEPVAVEAEDPVFHERVWLELLGEVLGCFCVGPDGRGACHTQVIANYLEDRVDRCERCGYVVATRGAPPSIVKSRWWGCRCPKVDGEAQLDVLVLRSPQGGLAGEELIDEAVARISRAEDPGYIRDPEEDGETE